MLTFDSLPQARVVRAGGQLVAPPPRPPEPPGAIRRGLRSVLEVAVGMWPLTATMMLAMAFFYLTALFGSP
jgi:hypothetical protein